MAQIIIAVIMIYTTLAGTSGARTVILLVIAMAAVVNNLLRRQYRDKNGYTFVFTASLVLGILLVSALNYTSSNYGFRVFFFFPLVELLLIPDKKRVVPLLALHLAVYIYLIWKITAGQITTRAAVSNMVFTHVLPYIGVTIVTLLFGRIINQRKAMETLNEELRRKVDELNIHSAQVRELTLAEERNRMARELHDMLGHSLVALNMHMDVLDRSIDANTANAHKIAGKCQEIISGSLTDLRRTVYALKEQGQSETLSAALRELAGSVEASDRIRVNLALSESADGLSVNVKDAIYKICKEAITNSIKHGNAAEAAITLTLEDELIRLKITDNGRGAETIGRSHGLDGMEERVRLLRGNISFDSVSGKGFSVTVEVPLGSTE